MREKEFWNWFITNNEKYLKLEELSNSEKDTLIDELDLQIHKVSENIFAEISDSKDELKNLTISAEGDAEYFGLVENLVKVAPKLEKWNIIAFKQPIEIGFELTYEDITCNSKDLWFLPLENTKDKSVLGIRLCFPNFNKNKEEDFEYIGYLMLDSILGEKSNTLNIHYLEVDKLDEGETENYIHLSELPKYIKWHKQSLSKNKRFSQKKN